ncbi:hypothetical protein F5Y04DRAFT_275280 [Hypomontagnella monticulosa]|nr:hypothetical protein F5Y04DRAFT_275280 [Hypomontagnella monticulosa]
MKDILDYEEDDYEDCKDEDYGENNDYNKVIPPFYLLLNSSLNYILLHQPTSNHYSTLFKDSRELDRIVLLDTCTSLNLRHEMSSRRRRNGDPGVIYECNDHRRDPEKGPLTVVLAQGDYWYMVTPTYIDTNIRRHQHTSTPTYVDTNIRRHQHTSTLPPGLTQLRPLL